MAAQITQTVSQGVTQTSGFSLWRVALKALALFIAFNVLYYVTQPLNLLNRLSVYNSLVPGRERLPFSEYPDQSYSLTVTDLDQMFASHVIAEPKAPDEYRVVMIGDSSVWGYLLQPDQTQAACLNQTGYVLPDGRKLRAYNLGYPKLTATKDLLILSRALDYQPDLVIWQTTLASLYPGDQLGFPIIEAQRDELAALTEQYQLNLPVLPDPGRFARTFFGQRQQLAEWLRYQLYGLAWAATGTDHVIPRFVTPRAINLQQDESLLSVNVVTLTEQGKFQAQDLAFGIVKAGFEISAAKGVPVLLVNEPIFRSNLSQVRWNTYYPRWAYDSYRDVIRDEAAREGWRYADLWDAVPPGDFTDTDFHLTPGASCAYAGKLLDVVKAGVQ